MLARMLPLCTVAFCVKCVHILAAIRHFVQVTDQCLRSQGHFCDICCLLALLVDLAHSTSCSAHMAMMDPPPQAPCKSTVGQWDLITCVIALSCNLARCCMGLFAVAGSSCIYPPGAHSAWCVLCLDMCQPSVIQALSRCRCTRALSRHAQTPCAGWTMVATCTSYCDVLLD